MDDEYIVHAIGPLASDGLSYYEGLKDGQPHGYGRLTRTDGTLCYEGNWLNGEKHGYGRYTKNYDSGVIVHEGQWLNGAMNGHGAMSFPDGSRYEGEFRNTAIEGSGVMVWPSGSRYEGGFRNSYYEGNGVLTLPDSTQLHGVFQRGVLLGRGLVTDQSGSRLAEVVSPKRNVFLQIVGPNELSGDSPSECCICMGAFDDDDAIVLTLCRHVFHDRCSREWLLVNGTCPLCRQQILSVDTNDGDDE